MRFLFQAACVFGVIFSSVPAKANTEPDNRAAVYRVFAALESGDVSVLNEIFADDGRNHVGGRVISRNGPHETFFEAASFAGALSERKVDVFEMIAEENYVAVRSRLCGKHTEAPIAGIEPSGRKVCGHYTNFYRFEWGKIVDNYVANDGTAIMRQVRGNE